MKVIVQIEEKEESSPIVEGQIRYENLPIVAPVSDYGWIRQKYMSLSMRAPENVYYKIKKAANYYYMEKITVIA